MVRRQVRGQDSTDRTQQRLAGDQQARGDGEMAEAIAARYLERHGLRILRRNYRCRGGEVDLVCRDGRALVFVEVRLRRSADYGGAAASITAAKQRRLILAAEHYLAAETDTDAACRFDCILLDELRDANVEWIRDAFSAA